MPPKTPPKQVKEDLQAGLQALTVVYTRVRMRPVIPDKTDDRYSTPDKSWGTGKKVRLPYQKVLDAVIDRVNIDRNAAGRDELGESAVLNQVISKLAKMAGGRREDADAFAAVCAAVNATNPETHAWARTSALMLARSAARLAATHAPRPTRGGAGARRSSPCSRRGTR